MKQIWTIGYHLQTFKNLFTPKFSDLYAKNRSEKEIFLFGLGLFVYTYLVYVGIYVFIFLLGYPYFSHLNEMMRLDFESKGYSKYSLFLNSYPWNVLYVLASLLILCILTSAFSYACARLLEEGKRSFRVHLGLCLHGMSILLACLFLVFIANTIFPFQEKASIFVFSLLVSIWILMFILGTIFSTRIFVNASHSYFGQLKRRGALTWLVPFSCIVYFIFGIVTGI